MKEEITFSISDGKISNGEKIKLAFKLLASLRLGAPLKKISGVLIIFVVLFYLISTDFRGLFAKIQSFWVKDSIRHMEISSEWVAKYNIILNNKMRMSDDLDGDKLSFIDEQRYNTNPFKADTDGDGFSDTEEIKKGYNPLGTGDLDNDHDSMPDKWEINYDLAVDAKNDSEDPDGDGLTNINEYLRGTNPKKADTDGDNYNDLLEIQNGYDPTVAGDTRMKVTILSEKINLVAPMIFSASDDESSLLKDLENGVVRYPKTGAPGQIGNTVVSGHSSNYIWAKGNYNYVFSNLNKLEVGDKIIVRVDQQNGKTFDYNYTIKEKRVTNPSDEWIFENSVSAKWLTLSTCWPLGTAISRLAIRAEMI